MREIEHQETRPARAKPNNMRIKHRAKHQKKVADNFPKCTTAKIENIGVASPGAMSGKCIDWPSILAMPSLKDGRDRGAILDRQKISTLSLPPSVKNQNNVSPPASLWLQSNSDVEETNFHFDPDELELVSSIKLAGSDVLITG